MPAERVAITADMLDAAVDECARRWRGKGMHAVWGVPRGGKVPAELVADRLGASLVNGATPPDPQAHVLIVDDLVDSGATLQRFATRGYHVDALYRKAHSPGDVAPEACPVDGWAVFPWEADRDEAYGPTDAVIRLIEWVGEDPARPGLAETPRRVIGALSELTAGYHEDPAGILAVTFDAEADQLVMLDGVEFTSLCEHHLLPFVGRAAVGYIPRDGRVVGISKLARLVECFARRLQLQERMTQQIASALEDHLKPHGVGVAVRAHHSCMGCRGVRKPGARMTTSAMLGYMRVDQNARSEFLRLAEL